MKIFSYVKSYFILLFFMNYFVIQKQYVFHGGSILTYDKHMINMCWNISCVVISVLLSMITHRHLLPLISLSNSVVIHEDFFPQILCSVNSFTPNNNFLLFIYKYLNCLTVLSYWYFSKISRESRKTNKDREIYIHSCWPHKYDIELCKIGTSLKCSYIIQTINCHLSNGIRQNWPCFLSDLWNFLWQRSSWQLREFFYNPVYRMKKPHIWLFYICP